jgi:hypothetical protein
LSELGASGGVASRSVDPLARIVFALVVLATFGAFGVTQWLKHTPTPVQQLEMDASFTPGANGDAGVERIEFHIQRSDFITVAVIDSQGSTVRTLARHRWLAGYKRVRLQWNGLQARRRRAPAGTYRLRVYLERQKHEVLSPVSFELLPRRGAR